MDNQAKELNKLSTRSSDESQLRHELAEFKKELEKKVSDMNLKSISADEQDSIYDMLQQPLSDALRNELTQQKIDIETKFNLALSSITVSMRLSFGEISENSWLL